MPMQKPECRFCKTDTPKHKLLKRRPLKIFEIKDDLIDLICVNKILIRYPVGYDKNDPKTKLHKKGTRLFKYFEETCDNHIVLLKEKVI